MRKACRKGQKSYEWRFNSDFTYAAVEAGFQRRGNGCHPLGHRAIFYALKLGTRLRSGRTDRRGDRLVEFHLVSEPRFPEHKMEETTAQACLSAHKVL